MQKSSQVPFMTNSLEVLKSLMTGFDIVIKYLPTHEQIQYFNTGESR